MCLLVAPQQLCRHCGPFMPQLPSPSPKSPLSFLAASEASSFCNARTWPQSLESHPCRVESVHELRRSLLNAIARAISRHTIRAAKTSTTRALQRFVLVNEGLRRDLTGEPRAGGA